MSYHTPGPDRVKNIALTDGSATLLQTHAVPTNSTLDLEVTVTLYKTSDGSEVAAIKEHVAFKNIAGTVTQLSTQPARAQRVRSKVAYKLTYTISTTNVLIKVTGENGLYAHSRVKRV